LALPVAVADEPVGAPTIARGVIDLVFREDSGWIIVDYKSERVDARQIPDLVSFYQPQVDAYADAWRTIVGEPVVETGLFFTHTSDYVVVESS
jgi:ATP-dependent helicase/nuclease subunit A